MGNNVNEQGFSMDDYMNFTGGAQQMMSGGGGRIQMQFDGDNSNGVPLNFGNRANGLIDNLFRRAEYQQPYLIRRLN